MATDRATPINRFKDDVRRRIAAGELVPGQQLPSARELAVEYGTAPKTIYRAVSQLKESGLLVGRQGKAVFVRESRPVIARSPQSRYQWEKDRALLPLDERRQTGVSEYDTGRRRDDLDFPAQFAKVPATTTLAQRFDVPEGTDLLRRTYRTTVKGESRALAMINSYLIWDMASQNPDLLDESKEPWPGGTMHQLLTIGIEVDRITDEIRAGQASPDESEILGIPSGAPILILHKTSYSVPPQEGADGTVVEFSEVRFAGEYTEMRYAMQLNRWEK